MFSNIERNYKKEAFMPLFLLHISFVSVDNYMFCLPAIYIFEWHVDTAIHKSVKYFLYQILLLSGTHFF